MPFYCASCQVLHQSSPGQSRAVSASLAPEENFSQDDPPVFGQRVVENSGVLKTVG